MTKTSLPALLLAVGWFTVVARPAYGLDADAVSVHGSVSATASYSDTYNYLGNTRDNLDLNLLDVVLNGTHRFESGLRAGAQLYAYKVGDMSDVTVDWASLDYAFTPWFGVRLGRNKTPFGLYNDSQDLDAVRTFASLPITFYPKKLRPVTSSADGLNCYGNVGLGRIGTLEYQVYVGTKPSVHQDTPLIRGSDNIAESTEWNFKKPSEGGFLFWNTPLDGLRVGFSAMALPKNELLGVLGSRSQLRAEYLTLPTMVDQLFGAGTWDGSGHWAGTPANITNIRCANQVFSLEYTRARWLFAAESKLSNYTGGVSTIPALARLGLPTTTPFSAYFEQYYGMATYQATDRVGLGLYYSYENVARKTPGSSSDPTQYTKDWAAAVSYAVNNAWILKVEGHLMNGRSLVWSAGDDNRTSGTGNAWTYLVVKSTFSF